MVSSAFLVTRVVSFVPSPSKSTAKVSVSPETVTLLPLTAPIAKSAENDATVVVEKLPASTSFKRESRPSTLDLIDESSELNSSISLLSFSVT